MRNIDFLKLYADAAGLRMLVLANRLTCETERERALHDWVAQHLAKFITFTRSALEADRRFRTNTDPAKAEDLGEICYNYRYNYENYWREEGDCDLWDVVPMEMVAFRNILSEIHRNLKIFLSRWGLILPNEEQTSHDCDEQDPNEERYADLHGHDEAVEA